MCGAREASSGGFFVAAGRRARGRFSRPPAAGALRREPTACIGPDGQDDAEGDVATAGAMKLWSGTAAFRSALSRR